MSTDATDIANETETTDTHSGHNHAPPARMIACPGCGIAHAHDPDEPVVRVPTYAYRGDGSVRTHVGNLELQRCPDCAHLRDRAEALLAAHPGLAASLGTVGVDRLEGALSGLAVLERSLPDTDATAAEVRSLIDRLGAPGGAARRAASGGTDVSPAPWAHVSGELHAQLRHGTAGLLADRLARAAPPEHIEPPEADPRRTPRGALVVTGACLLCGIASVQVPASRLTGPGGREWAARQTWRPLTCSPQQLGGRRSPGKVCGHVCPPCAAALDEAGAVGPSAREDAVLVHLRAGGYDATVKVLSVGFAAGTADPVPGWGALAWRAECKAEPEPEPNRTPWAHLRAVREAHR